MDFSRLKGLAEDLVAQNVDVIVATTPHAAQAAMSITRTTPIIVLSASDPVAWGLAQTLARPGWNSTGISVTWEDSFTAKWVELLKEVSPSLRHIALLRYPGRPRFVEVMEQAAANLNVKLTAFNVESTPALEMALTEIAAGKFDAMIVESSPLMWGHRARIIQLAAERRLPAMYSFANYVRSGGLMSYGTDLVELWRRGAFYVDRVLKGASPSELPFERWSKINLTINLKTAAALGLAVPETLLARADEVIE